MQFLAAFGPGDDNASVDEYEKNHPGFHHPIDQSREQLGLVARELRVEMVQGLQLHREPNVTRAHHVVNLEALVLYLGEQEG